MEVIDVSEFEEEFDQEPMSQSYLDFREREGIPVHTGLYIEDVNELKTGEWKRTGERGALINLYGSGGINDMHVNELSPGGRTKPQRHLYDELVYVSQGNGATIVGEGDDETMFEWGKHSLFYIPACVTYEHVNLSDDTPARLVSETSLPRYLNLIRNEEVIFNPGVSLWEQKDQDGYYSSGGIYEGEVLAGRGGEGLVWETNFISNVKTFDQLKEWRNQAGGYVFLRIPDTWMWSHIGEFGSGTYKLAHRHQPGSNIFWIGGEGYTLMWIEGWDKKIRFDWSEGTVMTPPALWFHHHFCVSHENARHIALHAPEIGGLKQSGNIFDPTRDGNEIPYSEEDPGIQELYRSELEARGLEFEMPEKCYTDPDYSWSM